MNIALLLKNTREGKNLSQAQLALLSGVRQSNISRIESGGCSANISTLEALAEGMGLRLVISFEERGEKDT